MVVWSNEVAQMVSSLLHDVNMWLTFVSPARRWNPATSVMLITEWKK